MCGRFTLSSGGDAVATQFKLTEVPQLAPRYNIAPTQPVAVVRAGARGRELVQLRWGLIPAWAKDPSAGARMINARAETAAEKPAFRSAMRQRRCLILADGFYEWQTQPDDKQPFYFQLAAAGPFAMAGLWEQWRGPDDSLIQSCTILTTAANALLSPIHDRMPVILRPADYAAWLAPEQHDPAALKPLLAPYPADAMRAHPVSKSVNKVGNDGPELIV